GNIWSRWFNKHRAGRGEAGLARPQQHLKQKEWTPKFFYNKKNPPASQKTPISKPQTTKCGKGGKKKEISFVSH
ncbi:hypothetical protein ACQWE9_24610, partial [Salmonella enterica subsp. enterica serovar Infantis]